MSRRVTIVMYHFVRDLAGSRYPAIKGLDSRAFQGQLDYIGRHYNVVTMEDVIAAIRGSGPTLPPRALLLTFDDGYADHFQTVFPLLDRLGFQGSFYPPARAILERKVLDVNKIHFLLAVTDDVRLLVRALDEEIETARHEYGLRPLSWYHERFARPNRWDPAEVIYIKRVLQHALPEALRVSITDRLFHQFVTDDETAFANELYVTAEQLSCMRRNGMHIGSHSYDHYWLNTLDPVDQESQVTKSMGFLEVLGCDMDNWTMCYPYGAFDSSLKDILASSGCALGLTTEVAIADLDTSDRFELARIDTNDLPVSGAAEMSDWTRAA